MSFAEYMTLALWIFAPIILLLTFTCTLFMSQASHLPESHTVITVLGRRRALISTKLTLAGLTYSLDGSVILVRTLLPAVWEITPDPDWKGVIFADTVGSIIFFGLAILNLRNRLEPRQSKRIKTFVMVTVLLDITLALLLVSVIGWYGEVKLSPNCRDADIYFVLCQSLAMVSPIRSDRQLFCSLAFTLPQAFSVSQYFFPSSLYYLKEMETQLHHTALSLHLPRFPSRRQLYQAPYRRGNQECRL